MFDVTRRPAAPALECAKCSNIDWTSASDVPGVPAPLDVSDMSDAPERRYDVFDHARSVGQGIGWDVNGRTITDAAA